MDFIRSTLSFFSVWSAILVFFHTYTYPYIDLHFLTTYVLVFGLYFSYVSPGYFVLNGHRITGLTKFFIDLVFHVAPFVFIALRYPRNRTTFMSFLFTVGIMLVYAAIVDISKQYQMEQTTPLVISALTVIVLLLPTFGPYLLAPLVGRPANRSRK